MEEKKPMVWVGLRQEIERLKAENTRLKEVNQKLTEALKEITELAPRQTLKLPYAIQVVEIADKALAEEKK